LIEQVEKFISKLERCIENNDTKEEPQLQFSQLCFNTLKEASYLTCPNDGKKIADEFFVACLSNATSYTRVATTMTIGG
jgi:hypothetical protein